MTPRAASLLTRLGRLEALFLPPAVECETCRYPANQCPKWVVVTADPSPLPNCPACGRVLHPETRQPFGHAITRVCVPRQTSETV